MSTTWGPQTEFACIVCEEPCELDNHEPFCSDDCREAYYATSDGPPDDEDAWAGGFAENH